MFTLSRVVAPALALTICLFGSASLRAENTVLSGMFDGSEPHINALQSSYCSKGPSGYRQTNFTVSETGNYTVSDVFSNLEYSGGLNVSPYVYESSFSPATPELHAKYSSGEGYYSFNKDDTYVLVVQDKCGNEEGAWAVALSGPGSVGSNNVVAVPGFTQGKFSVNDPIIDHSPVGPSPIGCGPTSYQQSGPIRVSRSGTYYLSSVWAPHLTSVIVLIYTAPVNPRDLEENLAPYAASGQGFELEAGRNYYFVAESCGDDRYGEYFYVVAPPAPFRINPGLSGTWYNPDTPGQGFFLTFYEQLNQAFLGWFTYTDDPAPGDEYGHRWMTAFGPFEGASAQLAIEWTGGGGFDSAQPAPNQNVVGDMRLDFTDCSTGQVTYAFGPDGTGGSLVNVIPIRRLTNDRIALCEKLYAGPGMPGPL